MDLKYTDFRRASYRNLHVCKTLLNNLHNIEIGKKQQVLHNTYYLSGYIIEFCYKYALFSTLIKKVDQNIYKIQDQNFQKKWKEHNFQKLSALCNEHNINFSQDIPFFGSRINDNKLNILFKAWDVQIRYSLTLSSQKIKLTEEEVVKFVEIIEEILQKITSKF